MKVRRDHLRDGFSVKDFVLGLRRGKDEFLEVLKCFGGPISETRSRPFRMVLTRDRGRVGKELFGESEI